MSEDVSGGRNGADDGQVPTTSSSPDAGVKKNAPENGGDDCTPVVIVVDAVEEEEEGGADRSPPPSSPGKSATTHENDDDDALENEDEGGGGTDDHVAPDEEQGEEEDQEDDEEEEEAEGSIPPDGNDFQSTFSVSEYPPTEFRTETIVDHLPVPPDGGYGWVIVAAAFVSNLVVDGIANSFGAFMSAYQLEFRSTKAATSFIGSLLVGAYLLSGPIAGGLLNKYEARRVVVGGAALTAAAFALSTLSPNIYVHCVVHGLFGGTGFGFIFLPAIVTVSQYFERRRALATGVAVSGSGVGTIVMPLLCKALVDGCGWRVALYALAALILVCCAGAGMFYRPLPVPEEQLRLNDQLSQMKQDALLAALSRADLSMGSGDGSAAGSDDDGEKRSHMVAADEEDRSMCNSGGTTPLRAGRPRLHSGSGGTHHANHAAEQPLLDSSATTESGGTPMTPPSSSAAAASTKPQQLSPITEQRTFMGSSGALISKSRAGSQHIHHHPPLNATSVSAAAATAAVLSGGRVRKSTLTSMNSAFTSIAGGMDFRQSRANLSGQLSRISARSYAQSLSRISQSGAANAPPTAAASIRGGDSVLSIALSGVDPKEFNRPLSRRDVFLQGSIRNLKEFEDDGCNYKTYRETHSISIPASVVATSLARLNGGVALGGGGTAAPSVADFADASSRMGGSRYSRITGGFGADDDEMAALCPDESRFFHFVPQPIRTALSEMIDVGLLREPVMLLLCVSNILGMIGFYVPFVFLIDLALEKGAGAAHATLLLSIIGVTNTFGRVFFGWAADRQWVSALALSNWSLILCGVLTAVSPLLPNVGWLAAYAALFGFIVSAYICLTSIVLSDLLGVERLTNSFGLLVVSRGFASLLGTPLAGVVYDATHSYDASFYFSGVLIALSGLSSCFIPMVHRHERSKLKNEGDYPTGRRGGPLGGAGVLDDVEAQSGKLSVLTEHSEEDQLTEYQRTVQSLSQQRQLIRELDDYRNANKPRVKPSKKTVANGGDAVGAKCGVDDAKKNVMETVYVNESGDTMAETNHVVG